ncbi:unnamed protein product [Echinostoma caproni]|uniref:Autophagy-related protein 9 n=1 Tax=Echinostoma caproni TaxID=27848 RepID=A0A183ANL0_9TREM|nr:unnamed protein product [Echinostoma caproni]
MLPYDQASQTASAEEALLTAFSWRRCFPTKSIVSVAGGATRAAVIQHQALDNNMADVAAKDGSQILAFLEILSREHWSESYNELDLLEDVRCDLVPHLWDCFDIWFKLIWFGFFLLTGVHLYANYRAVRCLQLTTFNRNRFTIAIQSWVTARLGKSNTWSRSTDSQKNRFPSVVWVNEQEPVLRSVATPHIHLGCSVNTLPPDGRSQLNNLIELFETEEYVLYCPEWDQIVLGELIRHPQVYVVLLKNCRTRAQLLAMLHAELLTVLTQITIARRSEMFSLTYLKLIETVIGSRSLCC